tara:strand:+ start:12849 stop:13169 length:321 start_codon:yes stop_codon:yes gene_type:complete
MKMIMNFTNSVMGTKLWRLPQVLPCCPSENECAFPLTLDVEQINAKNQMLIILRFPQARKGAAYLQRFGFGDYLSACDRGREVLAIERDHRQTMSARICREPFEGG